MTSRTIWATTNQRATNETLRTITENILIFKNKGTKLPSRLRRIRNTHLVQQLLQLLLQLHKVPGGDQGFLGLVQTVSGKFHQLVLNESEHTISQGQSAAWGTLCNDVKQLTLHLGCRLGNNQDGRLPLHTGTAITTSLRLSCLHFYGQGSRL